MPDQPFGVAQFLKTRHTESNGLLARQKQDEQLIGLMFLAPNRDTGDRSMAHPGHLLAEIGFHVAAGQFSATTDMYHRDIASLVTAKYRAAI